MTESNKKRINWFDKAWQRIVNVLGVLLILAGFLIIGFQIFLYLKNGEWIKLPLLYLVAFGPDNFVSWLDNPTSWLGLHKIVYGILDFIPVSLFSMLVGWAMTAYEIEEQNA